MPECPACGAEVEMSRLTGILGTVCRGCDAFNEPGTVDCVSCGAPLPSRAQPSAPVLDAGFPLPGTRVGDAAPPSPHDLPPLDFEAVLVDAPSVADRPGVVAGDLLPRPPDLLSVEPDLDDDPPGPFSSPPPAPEDPANTVSPIELMDPVTGITPLVPVPIVPPRPPAPPPLPFEEVELEPEPIDDPTVASAPAGPCALVVERGDDRDGESFPVEGAELPVGRSGGASFPSDASLAARHATFFARGGHLVVRDEGAPGGTFLRLRGLTVPLRPGDTFTVGDRLLRFAGPLPAAAPPAHDGTRRLGSPRPTGQAILLEERLAGGITGRVWLRAGPSITLGRAGCSVNLGDDPFLSQAHAEVILEGDGTARLRDLGSANGTFVRLPPRAERELRDGDLVRVGRQVLRVSYPGEREA